MKTSIAVVCAVTIALIASAAIVDAKPTRLRRSVKVRRAPQGNVQPNHRTDSMGNLVANILSNSGSGKIGQSSNANSDQNNFDNQYSNLKGAADVNTDAVAGNQEANLVKNQGSAAIMQDANGNQDAAQVKNTFSANQGNSNAVFDVDNMDAAARNTSKENKIAQFKDNNDATNTFINQ
ncbi:hypothetical protein BDF19DRAFT_456794 [Syncephalis fuscata]|nr:hypothetical protein BDF19DRAFT_456794 [Syncephalis fuscata]